MAKKMYYTEAEAAAKLHVGLAQLSNMTRDGKLRAFLDGARKMFKVGDVDALAGAAAKEGSGEIELAPADTGADQVSLSAADSTKPPTKEDTVITAEGISIFDDEDLEIEAADPLAKTQIAPSVSDQAQLEGVGSGSGLLDLTRESDDTSLGAEVLDHIDMEGAVGSSITAGLTEPTPYAPAPEVVMMEAAAAETMDAGAGLFSGVVVAAVLVMMLLGVVTAAAMQGILPSFVASMKNSMGVVAAVCLAVIALGAIAGFMMGKAVSDRQTALRRMGGQG